MNKEAMPKISERKWVKPVVYLSVGALSFVGAFYSDEIFGDDAPIVPGDANVLVVDTTLSTIPGIAESESVQETAFTDSLSPEIKRETVELWLTRSDVVFCSDTLELVVSEADLSPPPRVIRDDFIGPPDPNFIGPRLSDVVETPVSTRAVNVEVCLDKESFEFTENIINARMTTNPEIYGEGQEGQPSIYLSLDSEQGIEDCTVAREEMREKLIDEITNINEAVGLNKPYEINIRVGDYSIPHPCDDISGPAER